MCHHRITHDLVSLCDVPPLQDHNIYVYYPRSQGGGSKRLFRKTDTASSTFYPDVNTVRRDKSYIYEEFVMTQGTDIKVYAVGLEYAHAEGECRECCVCKCNATAVPRVVCVLTSFMLGRRGVVCISLLQLGVLV